MLTISRAQVARLAQAVRDDFVERLCGALRRTHPDEARTYGRSSLRRFVEDQVAAASGYGLALEGPIADFVGLALELGPEFHGHPLVWEVLLDEDLPPDARMDALFDELDDEDWEEVAAHAAAEQAEE